MKAQQIVLPFRASKAASRPNSNFDLIGRWYEDERGRVTIIGICTNDGRRVIAKRHPSGSTWSMPGWLTRLIFVEKKRRRRAA
jgi:hypothetical protein